MLVQWMCNVGLCFVFFFQAEDGIRDLVMLLEFRRVLFRSGIFSIANMSWDRILPNDSPKYIFWEGSFGSVRESKSSIALEKSI